MSTPQPLLSAPKNTSQSWVGRGCTRVSPALDRDVAKGYSPAVAGARLPARPGSGSGSASLLAPSGDCGGPSCLRRAVEGWVPLRGMVAGAEGEPGASRAAGQCRYVPLPPLPVKRAQLPTPSHSGKTPSTRFPEPRRQTPLNASGSSRKKAQKTQVPRRRDSFS